MTQATTPTKMHLDYDDWSPRYDPDCFYTMRLHGYQWITSNEQLIHIIQQQKQQHEDGDQNQAPASSISTHDSDDPTVSNINHHITMPMNCRIPTYYYKIIVYRGHHQHVLYRSYMQFEWLYHQLLRSSSMSKQRKLQSKDVVSNDETFMKIPHPLQGSLDDNDKCNFMGYCWIVQQIQGLMDSIKQQQFHHQQQHQCSMTTTTTNSEKNTSNMDHPQYRQYNSTLAETRCQQLSYFLTTILEQHGRSSSSTSASITTSASHTAVLQFFEL